ncbi:MAG: ATP-binding protein [Heteroscytonema crispum UTEX LB 1556]
MFANDPQPESNSIEDCHSFHLPAKRVSQTHSELQTLLHLSTDLWCAIATDGCFNQLNAAWEELLGWKQSELMAKSWLASVHQEDVKGVVEAYQSLIRGEVIQFENRHIHKNGSFRWVRWRMLLSENGCIYGTGRDMTAQKQRYQQHNAQMQHMDTLLQAARQEAELAKKQLQQKEQELRELQAEFQKSLEARVTHNNLQLPPVNDISQQIVHTLSYEDLLQSILEHLLPAVPHDVSGSILLLDTQSNLLEKYIENGQQDKQSCKLFLNTPRPLTPELQLQIEQRLRDSLSHMSGQDLKQHPLTLHHLNSAGGDESTLPLAALGSYFMVPLIASPYEDNRIVGLLFVGAEKTEQFNEEHIRLLYHVASHVSISIQWLHSFFVAIERRHLESVVANLPEGVVLLDTHHRIVLANPPAWDYLGLLGEIDASNVLQRLGDKTFEELMSLLGNDKSGYEFTLTNCPDKVFEIILKPVNLEIQPNYWLVVIRDIGDRKRVETEIRKALEKEKQLNALKSRVVRTVSHEYRTPLTTIMLAVQLLKRYHGKLDSERQLRSFHQIENSAKHLAELVDNMLLLNTAESGRLEFNPIPLDLVALCQGMIEDVRLLGTHQHTFTFVHQVECENVCLDPTLVRQILTNLLSNAINYSPDGGEVRFNLVCSNSKALFKIEDKGIGIPPEDWENLFDSFHRGSNVATIKGTGLGLAIVKKCVEMHEGKIWFESEVDVGTTFFVQLPC